MAWAAPAARDRSSDGSQRFELPHDPSI